MTHLAVTVSAGWLEVDSPGLALQPEVSLVRTGVVVTGRVVAGGTTGPGLQLSGTGESRAVVRPAVHLAVETLALHTVVHPALAGTEGEAGDVLVRTAGRDLALGTAGRVCVWAAALTLQLAALHPAGLTAALVTAVLPLRPVTPGLPLQSAV